MMEDLTFRVKSQYIERIVWILVIIILLVALVVISVYKSEKCVAEEPQEEELEEEPIVAAPEPEAEPEPPSGTGNFEPPEPPVPAGLSGQISFDLDRLICRELRASGNITRAKVESIGIVLENGKSDVLTARMHFYMWNSANEDAQETARTGDDPLLIGTLRPGEEFDDILNVANKPSSFSDVTLHQFLKVQVLNDADEVVGTETAKFTFENGRCVISA